MKKRITIGALTAIVIVAITVIIGSNKEKHQATTTTATEVVAPEPKLEYGINVDCLEVVKDEIKSGESLGQILDRYGVAYSFVDKIVQESDGVFNLRSMNAGKRYAVLCTDDADRMAKCFVYEVDPANYVVFDFRDSLNIYRGEKEVQVKEKMAAGVINSSLYMTMVENDLSPALSMQLSDIFAWSIDFFRVQKGDGFKVIYEDRYIDDTTYLGIGKVKAVVFSHFGEEYYAFNFEDKDGYQEYFDEKGKTLRKAFLKAPLNFSRISSRYNLNRYHPVLKRNKPHLGTDYAAPRGTPIMSTADGVIDRAGYTSGNGNYVKVRHNSTYSTQYLHMSKIKPGIKSGVRVRQGDVIGYVGSTGLATGPHVCYRFWKNGKQVDPYKQDLPSAEPIKEQYKDDYMAMMKSFKKRLDALKIPALEEENSGVVVAENR